MPNRPRLSDFLNDQHEHKKQKENDKRSKIRNFIRQGYSKEDVYIKLSQLLNFPTISLDQASQCFEMIQNGADIPYSYDEFQRELFLKILDEIERLQSAIATWPSSHDEVTFLNSRYAIIFNHDDLLECKFYLLDNFHGEKKQFEIEGLAFKKTDEFRIEAVDLNHILLIQSPHENNWFLVHLFYLDFEKATCIQLFQELLGGFFGKIAFDFTDRRNFVIWLGENITHDRYLSLGRIEDSKLVFEPRFIEFRHRLLCARLIGNVLQTMVPNWQETPGVGMGKCVFGEFTLVSGEHDPPLRVLFDLSTEIRAFMKVSYCWIGDDCFLAKNEYKNEQNAILKFNSTEGKLEATKYKFFCDNKLEDLIIGEEEQMLTVCVEHRISDQLTIHRFALTQPDTLSNLALFALRREAIFFDSQLYNKLFSRLSSNLEQLNIATQSNNEEPSTSGL